MADYAKAAKAAHVDFIVFLETYAMVGNRTLSAAALSQLVADCAAHSDGTVQLYPGYTMEHQFGNQVRPPIKLSTDSPPIKLSSDSVYPTDSATSCLCSVRRWSCRRPTC